jgi:hypothetical protein
MDFGKPSTSHYSFWYYTYTTTVYNAYQLHQQKVNISYYYAFHFTMRQKFATFHNINEFSWSAVAKLLGLLVPAAVVIPVPEAIGYKDSVLSACFVVLYQYSPLFWQRDE